MNCENKNVITSIQAAPAADATSESRQAVLSERGAAKKLKGSNLIPMLIDRARHLPREWFTKMRDQAPMWFDSAKPDTSREIRRFPVSAFAAVLAVAMSLMLIVASSVLLTRAEHNLNSLQSEISTLSDEVSELKSDFQTQQNLIEIYRIATEEYGMVSEEYIKMQYLALDAKDSVETFEGEDEQTVNLSAILSAIGVK